MNVLRVGIQALRHISDIDGTKAPTRIRRAVAAWGSAIGTIEAL
jgi:hypothetical protein